MAVLGNRKQSSKIIQVSLKKIKIRPALTKSARFYPPALFTGLLNFKKFFVHLYPDGAILLRARWLFYFAGCKIDLCRQKKNAQLHDSHIVERFISRSEADSNRCTRFCRPLPSHSAIRPYLVLFTPNSKIERANIEIIIHTAKPDFGIFFLPLSLHIPGRKRHNRKTHLCPC